jgi:GTPase
VAKKIKISIIGRPNVGKSTLVNRLAGTKVAITSEQSGTTRDRNHIDFDWEGKDFTIIDTGGISSDKDQIFSREILEHALIGIQEADLVIFLVDVTAGITKDDYNIAELLRKECKKPVYLAINKVDSPDRENLIYEFYQLGFDKLYPITALHGSLGLGDMLSQIVKDMGMSDDLNNIVEENIIRVAIVGKPNVGKSSLFNKLLGYDRSIVSDLSGTTRDAINTRLTREGQEFELIDTAGLRRKAKITDEVEKFSTVRTTHSIAACDVAVLIIDATADEILTDQDQKIASLILSRGKACVVLVNKWDLMSASIKEDHIKLQAYKDELDYQLRFIEFADKEFISAISGQRLNKIWQMIIDANNQHKRKVSTSLLNKVLGDIFIISPPPVVKQKAIKIKYITQIGNAPPKFLLFTNYPDLIPETYKRFLEKQFRQYFGFKGSPIEFIFRSQKDN